MRRSIISRIVLSMLGWGADPEPTIPKRKANNTVSGTKVKATKGKRHASQRSRSKRRK